MPQGCLGDVGEAGKDDGGCTHRGRGSPQQQAGLPVRNRQKILEAHLAQYSSATPNVGGRLQYARLSHAGRRRSRSEYCTISSGEGNIMQWKLPALAAAGLLTCPTW